MEQTLLSRNELQRGAGAILSHLPERLFHDYLVSQHSDGIGTFAGRGAENSTVRAFHVKNV